MLVGRLGVQPVRIARFHITRFSPRVGLPRSLLLIGSLTAALRLSKGWVRKEANLGLRTGRNPLSGSVESFSEASLSMAP